MKNGRTHLAHTAEHAVDLETGAIVGVTVQDASAGDTATMVETLITAAEQVEAVTDAGLAEIVGDKGYHGRVARERFRCERVDLANAHVPESLKMMRSICCRGSGRLLSLAV